jgi:hypothetical protein
MVKNNNKKYKNKIIKILKRNKKEFIIKICNNNKLNKRSQLLWEVKSNFRKDKFFNLTIQLMICYID